MRNITASLEERGTYKRDTFPKIILVYEANILVQDLLTSLFGQLFQQHEGMCSGDRVRPKGNRRKA